MEVYKSADNKVFKYIHNDGSETCIKTVPSCNNKLNNEGIVVPYEIDRNKFTVFLSTSVGCPIGCKFCYLTVKKYPYFKLTANQIINNFKESFLNFIKENNVRDKYLKLSFMGMGDAFLLEKSDISSIIIEILYFVLEENKFCEGVDSIDISTTLPKYKSEMIYCFEYLMEYVKNNYNINPKTNGSIIRLFYSLHACENRKELIPHSYFDKTEEAFKHLRKFQNSGVDIIIHQMFLEGVNDSFYEIKELKKHMNIIPNVEIRCLRFNKCPNSMYEESKHFDFIVWIYTKLFKKVKYQVSAGSEIKAACGQFICKTSK